MGTLVSPWLGVLSPDMKAGIKIQATSALGSKTGKTHLTNSIFDFFDFGRAEPHIYALADFDFFFSVKTPQFFYPCLIYAEH